MPRQGNIAFISQSGALGVAALEYAQRQKIGLSKFISIGNKADLHENHLLDYLKDDPLSDVILLYVEDLEDPQGFHRLATEITSERPKKIPILAIKSGRTLEGAKAATSHTGALAGSDEVYDSIFMQSGVLRVETIEELFDYAIAFAQQPLPHLTRSLSASGEGQGEVKIAIVTNAGGAGILATDAAVRHGVQLAEFTEDTVRKTSGAAAAHGQRRQPRGHDWRTQRTTLRDGRAHRARRPKRRRGRGHCRAAYLDEPREHRAAYCARCASSHP
jgi:acyl-CoA synthetase (NDP forming)